MCVCTMGLFLPSVTNISRGFMLEDNIKQNCDTQLTNNQTVFTYVNVYMECKCYMKRLLDTMFTLT